MTAPSPNDPGAGPAPVPTTPPPPNAEGGLWLLDDAGTYTRDPVTPPASPPSDDE